MASGAPMLEQLKTNTVINIGFAIIILILVVMTFSNIFIITKNNDAILHMDLDLQRIEEINRMRNAAQQRALILFQMTVMDDVFDRDVLYSAYNKEALNFNLAFKSLYEKTKSTTEYDLEEIRRLAKKGRDIQDEVVELIYIEKMDSANDILFSRIIPAQNKTIKSLTLQRKKQQALLIHHIDDIEELNVKMYWVVKISGLIAIVLGLIIAVYVSRHNKIEGILELEKKMAEEENSAKTEFLANMSHELRTPLHAVMSFSKFGLTKENASKEKIKSYFQHINSSGKRLLVLINNLLDIEKLESRNTEYNFSREDLVQTLNESIESISSLNKEKNIDIIVNVSKNVKRTECDKILISQVFVNLMSNAIKFSPENEKIFIEIKILKDSFFQFSIKDQGVGIPHSELTLIFSKFSQSSRTKTGSGGTGLGLSICSEIIDGHSGRIWAEQVKGLGACFIFEIPTNQITPSG